MLRLVHAHGSRTRTALWCVLANERGQRVALHGPRGVLVRAMRMRIAMG